MAYTASPQFNTYKTETIKFDGASMYRSGDLTQQRDTNIVNLYYDNIRQESKSEEMRLKKRPGLSATTYDLTKAAAADNLRGSYYDVDQNAFYWAVGTKLYAIKPDVATTVRTVTTLSTSTGYVGFCSFLKGDDTRYVVISDGTDLWVDDYVGVSCIKATAGYPTPHQPYPVYLNGYIFLIDASSGNIWNSDFDTPFTWTAGSYIQAEISSDYALRLMKAQNYLVCLGANSAEYFWDAGNATDSPLSRNDSPFRSVGYVSNLCTISDTTYFVGQDEKHNIGVYSVNSFKIERVSNPVVDRTLQTIVVTQNTKGSVNLDKDGFAVSVDGHTFYVLVTPRTTWAYDVDEKQWYEWKGSDGTGLKIEAVWGMYNGSVYCAIDDQTFISVLNPANYQDFAVDFTCTYTTRGYNFDTFNWKVLHRLSVNASQHLNTGTSNVGIAWSDDDWADVGTTARNVNIFGNSPFISRGGKFRDRSFRVTYTDNYPLMLYSMTLDLNIMGV